jgi:hypothetical protein
MRDDNPKAGKPGVRSIRPVGPDDPWPVGWEEHAEDQLLNIAFGTTPSQRLAWLEEALELAWKSGALLPAWERPPEN